MLIKLNNDIYDISNFNHPGGNHVMKQVVNKDVTALYHTYHYHSKIPETLNKYKVTGEITQEFSHKPSYDFHTELGKELRELWFSGANVAPAIWWVRTGIITAFFLYFEYAYHFYNSWYNALCLGIVYALIGLNIGHDAGHGAVSKNPYINNFFECYMDLIGNSSFVWFRQHVLQHHPYTNENEYDPDTKAGQPLFLIENPHILQIPFISLLGFSVMSKVTPNTYDYIMRIFLYYRIFSPMCVWNSFILIYTAGAILSMLFIVSHNNDKCARNSYQTSNDWYKNQIITSSTYGGKFAGFLTGGLNYQIEHHIFPKMNSCYYPRIQSSVKYICQKHNIPYHYYPTYLSNFIGFLKTACYNFNIFQKID